MNEVFIPRKEYPRPQFERADWMNLNGEWNFRFDKENIGEKEKWYQEESFEKKIIVPFTYETKASGIGIEEFCPNVWYQKKITIPTEYEGNEIILHFQAADYVTKLWVNGIFVGEHKGGQIAFSFNITNYIDGSNEVNIVVKNEDSQSCYQPRGKQRWLDQSYECWYVQTTGIWQTVWLEFVNEAHVQTVKITPDIDTESVEFEYEVSGKLDLSLLLQTTISFKGHQVKTFSQTVDRQYLSVKTNITGEFHHWRIVQWSPQNPSLYDAEFTLYKNGEPIDHVKSYFGMRKVSIENGNVLLNNIPIYQKLILDQGYWEESHLTPPSEEAIIEDIDKTLEMGFNGVRKQMKVEDQRYLYWADRKGPITLPSGEYYNI